MFNIFFHILLDSAELTDLLLQLFFSIMYSRYCTARESISESVPPIAIATHALSASDVSIAVKRNMQINMRNP